MTQSDEGRGGDAREPEVYETHPSDPADNFFVEAQWRQIEKGPEIIAGAAKEIMGIASILSGIYLAVLGIVEPEDGLPISTRVVAFLPFVPLLLCFVSAWLTFRPDRIAVYRDAPDRMREAFLNRARDQGRALMIAEGLLLLSLVAMVLDGFYLLSL